MSKYRLFLKPAATKELDQAVTWYEAQKPGLGLRMLAEVNIALARVQRVPLEFPLVHRSIRRALVDRFPYAAFFLVEDRSISVVAVTHLSRDPRRWRSRK